MAFGEWLKQVFGKADSAKPGDAPEAEPQERPASQAGSSEPAYRRLIEGLKSAKPEERLSCLGLLVNFLWGDDPAERAVVMKAVASVLKDPDMSMVHKAAGGLSERGGIGLRYLETAAQDPAITPGARAAILTRARMTAMVDQQTSRDLDAANMPESARKVVAEALEEARRHGFSAVYRGRLPSVGGIDHRYVFELDLSRGAGREALMSFTGKEGVLPRDEACLPAVKAFAQGAPYREDLEIPRRMKIRYFCWGVRPAPGG
jgi:hypothetical protein